jgi:hypothetical protein
MRLFLLHPLGTMSHRVRRGTWKERNQKQISTPERENILISKPKPLCKEVKNCTDLFINKYPLLESVYKMCHFYWDKLISTWNNSITTLEYHIVVIGGEDFLPNEYFVTGDKTFLQDNNLAALIFYFKLQLIRNVLKNGLVPPLPRIPINLERSILSN